MDFKYVQNYFENDTLTDYTMSLKAPIGEMYSAGISGRQFADELDFIASLPEVENIHIRICSPGGSVTEGMSIITSILNCKKNVITYADGFVASIASLIFISGNIAKMWDAGLLMFHGCSGGDKESLEYFNASLNMIYAKRLNKTQEEVTKWMSKDTYFTSADAVEAGIVDEVYETPSKGKYTEELEITAENVSNLFNMSVANIAQIDNKNNNEKHMEFNKIIEVLNLAPEATVEEVIGLVESAKNALEEYKVLKTDKEALQNSVDNYISELASIKNVLVEKEEAITVLNSAVEAKSVEVASLSEKVSAFEAEENKRQEAKIDGLVNSAIEANKINASLKAEWVEIATENYERAEKILNSIRPAKIKLTDTVDIANSAPSVTASFAEAKEKIKAKVTRFNK